MTTVQSVNVGLGLNNYPVDVTTPTTPRAPPLSSPTQALPPSSTESSTGSGPNTPTKLTFGGLPGQRPLPSSPFRNSFSSPQRPTVEATNDGEGRENQGHSIQSPGSQDVAMDDSDEGDGGSDAESIDAETGRPSKKKKGQRFFCTDFPPCKLSFTRSEHLARHIRKHTGERPFTCHCARRFSRLDNLRQHAQTVHVNEEIPGDSLAATGTRFQRQIRTDKVVRPNNSRSRASTASSQGSHPRGHARNLSASSMGSTASTISRDDGRRRPPPLMMANDPASRARLTLDVLRNAASTPPGQGTVYRDSSEGISTPTSTTFSTGQNSPAYGSSLGSPLSAVSRTGGGFWDGRSHGRRLSVPSGPAPLQSPQHLAYGSPYLSPLASSTASTFSNLSSSFGSPTSNAAYAPPGRDAAESDIRRRTWHPTTYYTGYSRPATSGLSYYQTPDAPRPAFAPQATAAASQAQRLPGIETFDLGPRHPTTPPARAPSPTRIDNAIRPPVYPGPTAQPNSGPNDRRGHASWDMSLHQNLTKLVLAIGSPSKNAESRPQYAQSTGFRPSSERAQQTLQGRPIILQENQKRSAEDSHYPTVQTNRSKRQGWYDGPPPSLGQQATSHLRNSPGTSSGSEGLPTTPSFPSTDHNPAIMHDNGHVESSKQTPTVNVSNKAFTSDSHQHPSWPLPANPIRQHYGTSKDTEMSGLEVLVAVATREENAAATTNA